MINKSENNKIINTLILVLLLFCLMRFSLVITFNLPLFSLTYVILVLFLVVFYYAVIGFSFRNQFFGINLLFLFACILLVGLSYLLTENSEYSKTVSVYLKQLLVLVLLWGLYVFLLNCSKRTAKICVVFYLVCIAISSVYTAFVAFVGGDNIIRFTASGKYDNSFPFMYGGFDFIFALVLIYTVILTTLRFLWRQLSIFTRVLLVCFEMLMALTIIVSGYGTAFALILIFTLWQLRPKGFVGTIIFLSLLLVVLIIPRIVTSMIDAIPFIPDLTSTRINEMILLISGRGSSGYLFDDGQRFDRIGWSLKILGENPLFGGFIGDTKLPFGYHTEWIDQLARYGFFFALFNAAFWVLTYRVIKRNADETDASDISGKCIKNSFLMFIILGFLDPISMVVTACPLFILSPFAFRIFNKKEIV